VILNFDPAIPASTWFLCYSEITCGSSLESVGQGFIKLLIRNGFNKIHPFNLHFWSSDPQIIRVTFLLRI